MAWSYMQGLHKVANMYDYGSICLNNAWICLNMPEYPLKCLNMAEYFLMFLNVPENA